MMKIAFNVSHNVVNDNLCASEQRRLLLLLKKETRVVFKYKIFLALCRYTKSWGWRPQLISCISAERLRLILSSRLRTMDTHTQKQA